MIANPERAEYKAAGLLLSLNKNEVIYLKILIIIKISFINSIFSSELPKDYFQQYVQYEIDVNHELRNEIFKQALNAEIILSEANYWSQNKSDRLVTGGIEVVDPAVPRKIAVSPRIKLIGAIAAIVGVCMGISIALIHEYFNVD